MDLNIASYFHMDTVTELGEAISRSTSVDELSLSYASTDLLTTFLSKVTNNYKANILSLLCDSRVSPTGKISHLLGIIIQIKANISLIGAASPLWEKLSPIADSAWFRSFPVKYRQSEVFLQIKQICAEIVRIYPVSSVFGDSARSKQKVFLGEFNWKTLHPQYTWEDCKPLVWWCCYFFSLIPHKHN